MAVTSLWADERVYYPLHVQTYTPAERLPKGKPRYIADSKVSGHTKPQIADPASLELLHYLARGLAEQPVLLLACYHADAAANSIAGTLPYFQPRSAIGLETPNTAACVAVDILMRIYYATL